ncbi:MAG: glycoside hydrolase family 3 protein [Cellulosilyticaceae bacterium]
MKKVYQILLMSVCFMLVGCHSKQERPIVEETLPMEQSTTQSVEQAKEQVSPIDRYIEAMTLEQKVGQLFMIAMRWDTSGVPITVCNQEVEDLLQEIPVGGVVLFKENIVTPDQVTTLIQKFQEQATVPLWISLDEEGGQVTRLGDNPAFAQEPFRGAFDMCQDENLAYNEAARMGSTLKLLGFNMNFAPVADIYNNPQNAIIGKRSFGTTKEQVAPMVIAFMNGLKDQGIMPVVKHFPGHGNTIQDSHTGIAYVDKSLETLENEELIPFKRAIEEGVEGMMIGHLLVEAVDPEFPASISLKWGEYLKQWDTEEVLLITDAMEMGAITNHYSSGESALRVIESGYDIILMPEHIDEAYEAVLAACKEGRLTEERLNKSVKKILSKKVEHNLLLVE